MRFKENEFKEIKERDIDKLSNKQSYEVTEEDLKKFREK